MAERLADRRMGILPQVDKGSSACQGFKSSTIQTQRPDALPSSRRLVFHLRAYFAGVVLAGAGFAAAAGVELALDLWLCFFTFAGAVVEVEFAAGAGAVAVWAAISVVPASNNMLNDVLNDVVIRVFIKIHLLILPTTRSAGRSRFTFKSAHLSSALTPMDARVPVQVHEVMFLNPFV